MHRFTTSYLSATQSTSTADSYPLSPSLKGAKDSLFHRPPVSNTALNLLSYRLGYQIGIEFRLPDFLNI